MRGVLFGLAAMACGDFVPHSPNLADPTCSLVESYYFEAAPDQCILLTCESGLVVFRDTDSNECGGVRCVRLEPGESAVALEKIQVTRDADWKASIGACELVAHCE